MTVLTTAAVLSLVMQCSPGLDPKLLTGFAQQESGYDPLALHINRMPPGWLQPHAQSAADAQQIAARFIADGHNVDLGMMQINSQNLGLLGLGLADAFDPCRSIAAAGKLIALISRYNTGNPSAGVRNGYAAAVVGRVHALKVADETAGRTNDIPPAHQIAPPEEVVLDDRPAWNDDEPQTERK
jgi:type IV secretion system protein VirB1